MLSLTLSKNIMSNMETVSGGSPQQTGHKEREKRNVEQLRKAFRELNVANQNGDSVSINSTDLIELRIIIERLESKTR